MRSVRQLSLRLVQAIVRVFPTTMTQLTLPRARQEPPATMYVWFDRLVPTLTPPCLIVDASRDPQVCQPQQVLTAGGARRTERFSSDSIQGDRRRQEHFREQPLLASA